MMTYLVAVICVIGIACGQILFKLCAISLKKSGSFFDPKTATILFSALVLYGTMTIAWIWVLQKIELARVYPIMALAFVLVPLGGYFILDEKLLPQYYIGVSLILAGIIVVIRA